MVKMFLQLQDCGFDSRLFCCQVTTLDKLFMHMPLSSSRINCYQSQGRDGPWEGTCNCSSDICMGHASHTSVVYPPLVCCLHSSLLTFTVSSEFQLHSLAVC